MVEEYTTEQAIIDIEAIIKKICPRVVWLDWIKELVEYHTDMNSDEKPIFWYPYDEYIQAMKLNEMTKRLEYELIEKGYRHSKITKYEPKNDFEDGVCNSIGYLHFIVHCMNPG